MHFQTLSCLSRLAAFFLLLMLLATPELFAAEFHNALSLQGFTGLLNTPNAAVTDEGKIYSLYSNQRESQFANRDAREESYLFSVGFFSFAELGGRLTDAAKIHENGGKLRDLSANFKVKMPFIPQGYYLPEVAFGMQDVGGGSKNLQTSYLVATEDWWRFRLSLGYGFGPDRMDGVFGGIELKAFDWLYLVAENDTSETNLGIRLVTSRIFDLPVNLQVTAKTSLDHNPGNMEFGFGLQFPLGVDYNNKDRLPGIAENTNLAPLKLPVREGVSTIRTGENIDPVEPLSAKAIAQPNAQIQQKNDNSPLAELLDKLVAGGFENVRIGTNGAALLVVEYENSRYDHNELDGIGVVLGSVIDTVPSGYASLKLIYKKKGLKVLQLSAPFAEFRGFLQDPDRYSVFNDSLQVSADVSEDPGVNFIQSNGNSSWLKSALLVYPALKTYVGTEVGVFDYLLSVKLDYYLNAWKGAVINARLDLPVSWSENFDDGKAFRDNRNSSQVDRLMLFQAFKPAADIMVNLGAGMVMHDGYGTLNEASWAPGNGKHLFMLKQAYVEYSNSEKSQGNNEVYLGSYRYYFEPIDLYLTGTVGKFYDNDKGFSVELKRFFGDTAFSVFYKNSRTSEGEDVQFGGVQIALPLTLRQDMKPYPLQLKGNNEWRYAQETKIVSPGSANSVSTSIGVNPQAPYNLEQVFYNRDRLSEPYIRKHLLRLRDAYITYRQP